MAGSGRLTSIEYFNSDKLFIKNESELEQENASGIFETRKYVVNHEMFFLGTKAIAKIWIGDLLCESNSVPLS